MKDCKKEGLRALQDSPSSTMENDSSLPACSQTLDVNVSPVYVLACNGTKLVCETDMISLAILAYVKVCAP